MNTPLTLALGFLGGTLASLIYFFILPQLQLNTVDMVQLIKPELANVAKQNLPQNSKIAEIQAFNAALKNTLQQYAEEHHVVVLSKPAVIAGSNTVDITATIAQKLYQQQPKQETIKNNVGVPL